MVVRKVCWSSRGPEFCSHHLHQAVSKGSCTHVMDVYTHTHKINLVSKVTIITVKVMIEILNERVGY